ncbi:unnamed protein product [Mytilus edulis]|uniref:Uncharacterized protein n=1 Tax=Mytilus edulis TaxID=6550 RepID=A0A8S3VLE6_MYTED|nr:unnamed protein product [Mytilus edulis]
MRQQAASVYFYGILLIFCILIVQSISQTISPGRTEKWENLMNGVLQNCVLETVDTNIATKVDKMAVDGAKVIYIDFNLYNFNESLIIQDQGSVYNPVSWVMTTGRHGQSLLLLRPQYEVFSLRSLSLGTERIEVSVKQTPMNCLADYNATVVSDALGEFLLHKFKTPSRNTSVSVETLKETDHICNLHIVPKNGKAIFHYMCCHKTLSGHTECQQLKSDKYLAVLFVCIFIVNFFAVMFSPLLVPSKCYQKKFETTSYEHKLRKPVILTVRKTSAKSKEQYSFPVSYFEEMTEFKKTVESMGTDITYIVTVSKINIVTEMARLMPSNRVPVGLFESLYKALIDCEVRKKRSMEGCCESNIFGSCKPFNREYPWYKILKLIMHFLLYVLVGMIWFVRLYVYFKFEQSERLDRQNAASQLEYLTFNKFLNGYLVDKMRDEVEKISMQSHEDQRNTAFQVSLDAFGDEYGISATNQMFATLAGGFLPYILRWVLFKDPEPVTVDPNNLSFKSKFRRKIKEYKQLWEVSDIIVDRFKTKETEDDNEVKITAAATDDENISQDEVIVLEENNSKDDTIMLEEINATVKDNTVRTVDLLIYDNFTV